MVWKFRFRAYLGLGSAAFKVQCAAAVSGVCSVQEFRVQSARFRGRFYLTECIYQLAWRNQLPYKIIVPIKVLSCLFCGEVGFLNSINKYVVSNKLGAWRLGIPEAQRPPQTTPRARGPRPAANFKVSPPAPIVTRPELDFFC